MNKKIFSVLSSNNKTLEIDNGNNTLFPEIPFYGIKGSIHKIEEAEESYYKILYSDNGKIDPIKKPVPKNKGKNLASIIEDYHNDLKTYLEINNDKYLEYRNISPKKKINDKNLRIALIASSAATIISIPILFMSDIGAIIGAVSALSLYKVYDIKRTQESKEQFIKQYDIYQKSLVSYIEKQSDTKKVATTYTKIAAKEDPSLDKNKPKILILTKEEKQEAA